MLLLLLSPLLLMSTAAGLSASEWEGKPWFCHDLDCPVYSTDGKTDTYEVREYEAGVTTTTPCVVCPDRRSLMIAVLR